MEKIAGKLLVLFLVLYNVANFASITLRALDGRGNVIDAVQAGKVFTLEIRLDDQDAHAQDPHIQGVNQLTMMGRQTNVQVFNGVRSMRYIYKVRIEKPGTYTVGPAFVTVNNQQKKSEALTITITKEQPSVPDTATERGVPVFMRMSVDTSRVVVGEKVRCTLKIFCKDRNIGIHDITPPQWDAFVVKSQSEFEQTVTTIDGVRYLCLTAHWDVLPTQQGEHTLKAFCGDFKIPLQDKEEEMDAFLSHMLLMMQGPRYTLKRAYSNAVTVHVDPLPATDKSVQALGELHAFTAHGNPDHVQEGEAVVLTLALEGKGDLSDAQLPQLQDMPEALKVYPSKNYTQSLASGLTKKSFEYIMQATSPGTWRIPSQQYTYFDTKKRTYNTLKTAPLTLVVTPVQRAVQQSSEPETSSPVPDKKNMQKSAEDTFVLDMQGPWYREYEHMLPWWFFVLCLVAPCVWVGWRRRQGNGHYTMSKKRVYARAYKLLERAQQQRQAAKIYPIFMEVLAARWGVAQSELTQEYIENRFKELGVVSEKLRDWNQFYAHMSEYVYSLHTSAITHHDRIFEHAFTWLTYLETKV
ncbi:MAG TPA: BatD family protein [Candidatus Limnocylindria bacterium]|nr:BatD family protein [Candidatus Limnocylindria bacterium]